MAYIKGIDVSEHNGVIDWEKVKGAGVRFAMVRGGYGLTVDKRAARNLSECNRLGIPCGVYWFSYALTAEQAAQEAAFCLAFLKPYRVDFPVTFDLEYDSVNRAAAKGVRIGMTEASGMARAFLRAVRKAGYIAVNYSNVDYLRRYFDRAVQEEFPLWLAQWPGGTPELDAPPRTCDVWQYSQRGKVDGIGTDVDLDVCYVSYEGKEEDEDMTGEQIFKALNEYLDSQPVPEWAKDELEKAKAAGITDGSNPMRLVPRYQAAILALRAKEAEE